MWFCESMSKGKTLYRDKSTSTSFLLGFPAHFSCAHERAEKRELSYPITWFGVEWIIKKMQSEKLFLKEL